jgi:hypothetical protein
VARDPEDEHEEKKAHRARADHREPLDWSAARASCVTRRRHGAHFVRPPIAAAAQT